MGKSKLEQKQGKVASPHGVDKDFPDIPVNMGDLDTDRYHLANCAMKLKDRYNVFPILAEMLK